MKRPIKFQLALLVLVYGQNVLAQNLIQLGASQRYTTQKEYEDGKFSKGAWCDMFIGKKCSVPYSTVGYKMVKGVKTEVIIQKSAVVKCSGPAKALNKNIKSAARFVHMEPSTDPNDSALMLLVGMAGEGMNAKEPNLQYSGYDEKPDGTGVTLQGAELIIKKTGPIPDGSPSFKENYLKEHDLTFKNGEWNIKTDLYDGAADSGDIKPMIYADSWNGTGADNFFRESKRLMKEGLLPKEYESEIANPNMLVNGQLVKTDLGAGNGKGMPNFLFSEKGCNELNNVPRYTNSHDADGFRKNPDDLIKDPNYEFSPVLKMNSNVDTNQTSNNGACKTSVGKAAFGQYCLAYNKGGVSPDCGSTEFTSAESVAYATAALWKDSQKRFRSMEAVMRAKIPGFTRPMKDEEIVFWTKVYFNGGQGSQASADIMFQYYAENSFFKSDEYLYQRPSCASPCSMIQMGEIWDNGRVAMDTYMVLKKRMQADPQYCLNNDANFPVRDGENYDLDQKPTPTTDTTSGSVVPH
jgi:hypothetical protein